MQWLPFPDREPDQDGLAQALLEFRDFGSETRTARVDYVAGERGLRTNAFVNEFWTAKQRAASSLHEVSYRACFKPQLPRFFIDRLTEPGDVVYDPFMGRGTTVLEAALADRVPVGCDVNPLSRMLVEPRLAPPTVAEVEERLAATDLTAPSEVREDLAVFYHPDTLREICALRECLLERERDGRLDLLDAWIRMVAVNRLTGHSAGFFSVYTMPPNQAVSIDAQHKINARREQTPPRRDVAKLIVQKTRSLLARISDEDRARLARRRPAATLLAERADATAALPDDSVRLVVTSPPFLDVVQYKQDNWLRCWFCGIDPDAVEITMHRKLDAWQASMQRVFEELHRVLQPHGHVAFEVGEVRGGKVKLDEAVLPCASAAGLVPELVLINQQDFTKTANCWGIDNNAKGTNTNRVVVLRKRGPGD